MDCSGAEKEREGFLFSWLVVAQTLQINSFAPLAPLSSSHRVGAPEPESDTHDKGPVSFDVAIGGLGTAVGAALPPPSLLPGVEEPAGVGADSTSTEAPQLGAQEGTAGPSVGPAAGDEAEESKGLDTEPELTDEEKAEVDELKDRDREVRQHEQAHMAAAGPYAKGGPSYEYTRGPDGKRYAVGGEVQIDTSKESDPEATIRKAQQIYRAALAPAEPSSQDRSVASQAKKMEMEARSELREQQDEEGTLGAEGSAAEEATPATQEPSEGPASIDLPGSGPSSDSEPNAGFVGSHASAPGPSSSGSSPSMQGLLDLLA